MIHKLSMLTFPSAPQHTQHPDTNHGSDLGELESQPSSSDTKTRLTDFSQIPKILHARFRCVTSFTSPGHNSIWDFYFDISEWHILPICVWILALMLHLTNPCTKWKVLSLTKPNGKIYKMKSFSHYITCGVLLRRRLMNISIKPKTL